MWSEGRALSGHDRHQGPHDLRPDALGYSPAGFFGIWLLEWVLCWLGLMASWQAFRSSGSRCGRDWQHAGLLALYGTRYYYGNMTWRTGHSIWPSSPSGLSSPCCWTSDSAGDRPGRRTHLRHRGLDAHQQRRLLGCLVSGALLSLVPARAVALLAFALLFSSLLGLALVGGPLYAYFQHHDVLAEFKILRLRHLLKGATATASLLVGAVGLLRTGLIMLLPAFLC